MTMYIHPANEVQVSTSEPILICCFVFLRERERESKMTLLRWTLWRPIAATLLRPRHLSTSAISLSDRVNPAATHFTSSDPTVPVKLRMESTPPASDAPICIQTMFRNTVRACPHHKASEWKSLP